MGVRGLWSLLLPIGRRISIETLESKVLAIDASIWLTQFLKAMRDPDTGSVRPAAHLIGFFRRLCKLRFHGIRPVLVFDGATPEIKKRELQLRRQRREQVFASHEQNTVQRMAKRILVDQLKKKKQQTVNGGAFAPGFQRAQEDMEAMKKEESTSETQKTEPSKREKNAKTTRVSSPEDSKKPTETETIDLVEDWEGEAAAPTENAWDTIVVDESDESNTEDSSDDYQPNKEVLLDVDRVVSLPSHARKDAIEDAQRQQRMRSRREFMPVAAKPVEYSQVQLRNFLRSSRLNQEIEKMATRAANDGEETSLLGERIASDATRRIIFTKDGDKTTKTTHAERKQKKGDTNNNNVHKNRQTWSDDEEFEWKDPDVVATQDSNNIATESYTDKQTTPRKQVAGENNDDSYRGGLLVGGSLHQGAEEDVGGGGFLIETDSQAKHDGDSTENSVQACSAQEANDEAIARALQESEMDGSDNEAVRINDNALGTTDAALAVQLQAEEDDLSQTKFPAAIHKTEATQEDSPQANTPATMEQIKEIHIDGDQSDDDVDWEDGDNSDTAEIAEDSRSSIPVDSDDVLSPQLNPTTHLGRDVGRDVSSPTKENAPRDDVKVPDVSVAVKAGEVDTASKENTRNRINEHSGQLPPGSQNSSTSAGLPETKFDPSLMNDEEEEDVTQAFIEDQDEGMEGNDFDHLAGIDDTTAALEHAQATASNLTDWAGRAFRRAIAKHVEETGASMKGFTSLDKHENGGETIDLTPKLDNKTVRKSVALASDHSEAKRIAEKPAVSKSASVGRDPASSNDEAATREHSTLVDEDKWEVPVASLQEEELKFNDELHRQERDMDTVTDEMKQEVISLIQLFGIPYVEAPAEAEAQCATLEELGLVDGIVTEDSDVFVFGGKNVYKNIFDDQKYVEAYTAKEAQRDLALGRNEFVALAMLLGGDYTDGVKGVGVVNGMEILQAFSMSPDVKNGLNKFRQWLDGFDPEEVVGSSTKESGSSRAEKRFHESHRSARNRWSAPKGFPADNVLNAYTNPVVDKSRETFSWGVPDLQNLTLFCQRNMGWAAQETESLVKPVLEKIGSGSRQTRIESFFMKYEDDIKFARVNSKRLRDVFRGIRSSTNGTGQESAGEEIDSTTQHERIQKKQRRTI